MAKLQYSYETERRSPLPGSSSGLKRRAVLFILFLFFAAVAIFLLKLINSDTPEKELPQQEEIRSSEITEPLPSPQEAAAPPQEKTEEPILEATVETPVDVPLSSETQAFLNTVQALYDQHEYVQIHDQILQFMKEKAIEQDNAAWRPLMNLLSSANSKILFTDIPFAAKKQLYTVEAGDSLDKLARQFQTTIEAIQIANKLDPVSSHIRIGQKLRIYQGAWRVEVCKKKNLLKLYDGEELFKIYDIGVGRQNRTPVGNFQITAKIKDPPWYSPDGRVIAFGEKENILGSRWLNLKPVGDTDPMLTGYGIHGTWEEDSEITKPLSNGCIRMRNQDVEELANILPHQIAVTIMEE